MRSPRTLRAWPSIPYMSATPGSFQAGEPDGQFPLRHLKTPDRKASGTTAKPLEVPWKDSLRGPC